MRGAHAARAALLVLSVGCGGMAAAGPSDLVPPLPSDPLKPALSEHEETIMPSGFASLCGREPHFCSGLSAPPRAKRLPPARLDLLARVNSGINHRIVSTTDQALYGQTEYWTIPKTAGDCEDYVLLKRQTLMRLGLPAASLLITVVHDENGEGHAVLTVPMAGGDLVLDNRRDQILRWWATGYDFVKRQSKTDPERWVSLGAGERATANIASGPNGH